MTDKFEEWVLIELFGHQRIAGKVSEQQIGGESFVRVDVPETKHQPAYTKLFGKGAIYAITMTDERSARAATLAWAPEPMGRWEMDEVLRKQRLLKEPEPELTKCRECGCDELHACQDFDENGNPVFCHWVEDDLCSACATKETD